MSVNGGKKLEGRDVGATLRFDLDLAPPTDDFTNEFSYIHLVKDAQQDGKKVVVTIKEPSLPKDPLNPDCDDDSLVALAKKFEEKYGPRKRKRVLHESDLIDRGLGYDLTDTFVDDSEMYENYVPHQLDTKFGGFYVNMGRLEFKQAEDLDDSEGDFVVKKATKKPKVKKLPSFQSTPQAILASQKLKKAKQRAALQKAPPTATTPSGAATSLSGAKKLPQGAVQTPGASGKPPPAKKVRKQSAPKFVLAPGESGVMEDSCSWSTDSPSQSTSPSLLTGSIVSTAAGGGGGETMATIQTVNLSTKLVKDSTSSLKGVLGSEVKSGPTLQQQVPKEPPTLPSNLPTTVLSKILALEQLLVAAGGKISNKSRNSYDQHLVNIQQDCRGLTKKARTGVFDYLAYKMGVGRMTLVKRIKQEQKKREDTELEKYILDLKRAVDLVMPEQIEQYEKEVRARNESMSSQVEHPAAVEVEEESKLEDVFDESTAVSSTLPSAATAATAVAAASTSQSATPQEKIKRPPVRKRFRWNDEIRKLLCAVVKVKITCEEASRAGMGGVKADWEEIIGSFLDNKIKPIWPKGWMQKSILYKTSEIAHKHLTNPQNKKVVAAKKEKPISTAMPKKEQPLTPTLATPKSKAGLTPGVTLTPQITSPSILAPSSSAAARSSSPSLPHPPAAAASQKPAQTLHPAAMVTSKEGVLQTLQGKLLKAAKVAIPKSTKKTAVAASASLGGKSTPVTTTSSMTTYLLSAGSLNIEQLLQGHLPAGTLQLLTSSSPSASSPPLSASSVNPAVAAKTVAKTMVAPKVLPKAVGSPGQPKSRQTTLVANPKPAHVLTTVVQATRVTPTVIQAGPPSKLTQATATAAAKVTPALIQAGPPSKLMQANATTAAKVTPALIQPRGSAKLYTSPAAAAVPAEKPAGLAASSAQPSAIEIGRLESVVSKIVGSIAKQPQQQQQPQPPLRVKDSQPSSNAALERDNSLRLHLTKKATVSSPQVVFPGEHGPAESAPQVVVKSSTPISAATLAAPPLNKAATPSSVLTPISCTEREVGMVKQTPSSFQLPPFLPLVDDSVTLPLLTEKFGSPVGSTRKSPPPLIGKSFNSQTTPSPRSVLLNSGTGSVSMVPDTPPTAILSTLPPPHSLNHHSMGVATVAASPGFESEDPCLSPLKSPVEQILGEHSYPGTSS